MKKKTKIIVGCLAGLLILFISPIALLLIYHFTFCEYQLDGPTSPTGYRIIVDVEHGGFGWGRDFNSNIEILDKNNETVFHWRDESGRDSHDRVKKFIEKMKWFDDTTFVFYDDDERIVVVQYPDTGYWNITNDPIDEK